MLLFLVEASLNKDQSLKPNPSQNKKNKEKKWKNRNSHPVLFIQVALRCAVILLITSSLQI